MIEVNLLPGAKRRTRSKAAVSAAGLRSLKLPEFDRWLAFIIGAWVLGAAIFAWLFLGTRAEAAQLDEQIQTAVADSTRFAGVIAQTQTLRAQRDTIAQKLEVIQEIDEGRYLWPHVMEELARALPDYTWLTSVVQLEGGEAPVFQLEGRTGNNFALTRFMSSLEASPFIRGIRLLNTSRITEGEVNLHAFTLEARYESPPADLIRTVPLFAQESVEEDLDGAAAE